MKHVPRVKQETSVWHAKMEGKGLQCLPEGREGQLAQGFFRTVYHEHAGVTNVFKCTTHCLGDKECICETRSLVGVPSFYLPR